MGRFSELDVAGSNHVPGWVPILDACLAFAGMIRATKDCYGFEQASFCAIRVRVLSTTGSQTKSPFPMCRLPLTPVQHSDSPPVLRQLPVFNPACQFSTTEIGGAAAALSW